MKSYSLLAFIFLTLLTCVSCKNKSSEKKFLPGEIWKDTDGKPINAHGGGILFHDNKYYWFGEIKNGKTWRVENIKKLEDYR